jgi:hypothetical protein
MSLSHRILKTGRLIHLYLGVFTAPALLFFALTGGLQTFSLHETTRGSSYQPPAWLVTMAQLHKKQTTVVPVRKPRPAPADATPLVVRDPASGQGAAVAQPVPPAHALADAAGPQGNHPLPLKIFFAFVALSLFLSTLLGLYMAYKYSRNATRITAVLLAGVIVPILLVLI